MWSILHRCYICGGGPHHGTIDVTHDYIVGNKCSLLPRDVQYMLQLIHLCHIDIKTSTSCVINVGVVHICYMFSTW